MVESDEYKTWRFLVISMYIVMEKSRTCYSHKFLVVNIIDSSIMLAKIVLPIDGLSYRDRKLLNPYYGNLAYIALLSLLCIFVFLLCVWFFVSTPFIAVIVVQVASGLLWKFLVHYWNNLDMWVLHMNVLFLLLTFVPSLYLGCMVYFRHHSSNLQLLRLVWQKSHNSRELQSHILRFYLQDFGRSAT